jgi:hypothetical protein
LTPKRSGLIATSSAPPDAAAGTSTARRCRACATTGANSLKCLRPSPVVTVTRIDRLARSTFDLFGIVTRTPRRNSDPWPSRGPTSAAHRALNADRARRPREDREKFAHLLRRRYGAQPHREVRIEGSDIGLDCRSAVAVVLKSTLGWRVRRRWRVCAVRRSRKRPKRRARIGDDRLVGQDALARRTAIDTNVNSPRCGAGVRIPLLFIVGAPAFRLDHR